MKKSIFKYLLIICLVAFSLVGCNSKTENNVTTTNNPTTVVTTNNVTTTSNEHEFGAMFYARPASFLADGNIAYYKCSHCDKYFDENYNEVESVIVPKWSNELVLFVNGEYKADITLVEEDENHIYWALNGVNNLKKDDVVTIRSKNDTTTSYEYFTNSDSLFDSTGKVHNDAISSDISISFTPNGMYVSATGFEYDGFTIIVNKGNSVDEKPMSKITYDFGEETESYIYGYYYFEEGDTLKVYDHSTNTSYGFDNVYSEDLWQTNTFERNSDGLILIKRDVRMGVEFIIESSTILLDAVYSPGNGNSYSVEVYGSETPIDMEKESYDSESEEYEEATFVLLHETTVNNSDVEYFINTNGYVYYGAIFDLNAGDKFKIKDNTNSTYVDPNHLLDLYGFENVCEAIEFDGEYVKVLEKAKYIVVYSECVDGFIITKMESTPVVDTPAYLVLSTASTDGGQVKMIKSETDDDVYSLEREFLVSDVFSVLYNATNYAYSDIEVGQDLVTSIISGGYAFLMVKVAGTYTISFNTDTKKMSLVLVEEKTDNVLVACKLYDSKKLTNMTLVGEEFTCTIDVEAGMYLGFMDQDSNSVDDAVLSEPYDTSKITMLAGMIYFIGNANITVYINRTTHVVRVVVNE